MKLGFVWIGKTREKNWRALQDEYLKRVSFFAKCDISEIKESAAHETAQIEGERILKSIKSDAFVILLAVEGKMLSSHQFSGEIEKWQNRGLKEAVFVIGGQDGVSPDVEKRADFSLSLSRMTLTHETARVILLEQIYRAYTIIKGFPYQK